jgi:alkylhydroperoxidase family enzyme
MGVFAHHPDLAHAFFAFNAHVLYGTTLTVRQRELLALRTAVVRRSPYLWSQHLVHTDDAGLSSDEIAAIAFGPEAPSFEDLDTALLEAVDELLLGGQLSDRTWAALIEELDLPQVLDVIFTVGCYATVASMCESLRLDIETDLAER